MAKNSVGDGGFDGSTEVSYNSILKITYITFY